MNPLDRLSQTVAKATQEPGAICEVVAGDVVVAGGLVPVANRDQVVNDLVKGAAACKPAKLVVQHAADLRHLLALIPSTTPGG